ncbi:MAG: DoxX family protein [Acidobacteria bacterium]|nr:DoxX family protein [Acidobacteriota bacterium]
MVPSNIADTSTLDIGLFIARLVVGLLIAAHGAQKLFGWFGGYGLEATGEFFGQLGFQPGRLFATAAALGELLSGLLIALGLMGPVGPAILLAVMVVAAMSVHWQNGLFASSNGIELPLLYGTAAVGLALGGPGRYSLDALLALSSAWTPAVIWGALAVGAIGGIANLALRRRPTTPVV